MVLRRQNTSFVRLHLCVINLFLSYRAMDPSRQPHLSELALSIPLPTFAVPGDVAANEILPQHASVLSTAAHVGNGQHSITSSADVAHPRGVSACAGTPGPLGTDEVDFDAVGVSCSENRVCAGTPVLLGTTLSQHASASTDCSVSGAADYAGDVQQYIATSADSAYPRGAPACAGMPGSQGDG